MNLGSRFEEISTRLKAACQKAKKSTDDITLIAVTKAQPFTSILESYGLGITNFGESYVQEAVKKHEAVKMNTTTTQFNDICWHFIGGLQTNKIKYLGNKFRFIHSICNERQIAELDRKIETPLSLFFELNVGEEGSKTGASFKELLAVCENAILVDQKRKADGKHGFDLMGLMCIPPYSDNKGDSRKYFSALRENLEKLNTTLGTKMTGLSMGMSHDFDIAIEEGATHVRIGTALYGERG